ncbi:MAG: biotin--[acetyl-CoA-carboxylase] ligase [Myxococcota bacterium]
MTDVPEDLLPERIQGRLQTRWVGRSLEVRGETASTMDDARAACSSASSGHVVLADRQTRGRGARGRGWASPGGTDLYFSVVARPELPGEARPILTLSVGLGVAEAAEALSGVRATIKWPNDVWLHRRKCAGVLVETTTRGDTLDAVVIGVGLNVNRTEWPAELAGLATSLRQERTGGAPVDRAEALARTLEGIEAWIDRLVTQGTAPVVDALSRRLALLGEEVVVDDLRGVLDGVSPKGAARIRTANGMKEVLAGTLRPA